MGAPLEHRRARRAAGRSEAPRRPCSATGCRAGRRPGSREPTSYLAAAIIICRGLVAPGSAGAGFNTYMATPRAVAPSTNRQHRRSAQGGEAAASPRGLRLHRRRRGSRDHARENCRAYDEVVVPAALRGGERQRRPAHDRARDASRAALPPGAGRQHTHVLPARRRGRGARRRRGRDGLHPVDAVGLPARGCAGARRRVRRGISCISSADATSRSPSIARARKAGYSALVVTIDTPVAGHARTRPAQRHEGAGDAQSARDAAVRLAVRRATALARGILRAMAG